MMCPVCGVEACGGCGTYLDAYEPLETPAEACDCPTYKTVMRTLAASLETLEAELGDTRATLHDVLDYVRWEAIPQGLIDDIDAIFDGNTDEDL